jgi:dihydrofolate reductase
MRIEIVVAWSRHRVIGNAGTLPWHLPEDLAHFKRITLSHPILMGRRTWDSIGRPLPGRRNIVITRDDAWNAAGAQRADSLDAAIRLCGGIEGPVFVIGGAQIFEQALRGRVDAIHATVIDAEFPGDTYFPALDPGRFRERTREHFPPGGARSFGFDFVEYAAIAPH